MEIENIIWRLLPMYGQSFQAEDFYMVFPNIGN